MNLGKIFVGLFLLTSTAVAEPTPPEGNTEAASSQGSAPDQRFIVTGLFGGFQGISGNTSDKKLNFAYGGRAGYVLDDRFRVSAQYTQSSRADLDPADARYHEITIIPTAHAGGFYLGPQLGVCVRAGEENKSTFAYGVDFGFENPVSENFSISYDVQFTGTGATTIKDPASPIQFQKNVPSEAILKFMLAFNFKF